MLLANGEMPTEPTDYAPLSAEIPDDTHWALGMRTDEHTCAAPGEPGEECDCEHINFSTRACDGCNCHLAGDRHAASLI